MNNLFPITQFLHFRSAKCKMTKCDFFFFLETNFLNQSITVLSYTLKYWHWPQRLSVGTGWAFLHRAKQDPAQLLINSSCRLLSSQFLPSRQPRRVQSKPATLLPHFAFACQVCSVSEKKKEKKARTKPDSVCDSTTELWIKRKNLFTCVNSDLGGSASVVASPSPTPPFMYSSRTVPRWPP